jgi:hypothetical protein
MLIIPVWADLHLLLKLLTINVSNWLRDHGQKKSVGGWMGIGNGQVTPHQ